MPLKECDSSEMVSDVENDTIPQEHDTIEQNEEGGEEESSEFEERKAVVSDENAINDKQGVNEEDRPIADHGPDVGDHDTSGKQEERREGQGSKDGVSKDEGGACVKTSDVADEKNEENDKVAAPVDEIHSEKADENQVKDDDSA